MSAHTHTAWREHALDELERAGYRRGEARTAVVDVLAREPCALTAQEIGDTLRRRRRRVGLASVYRALEVLNDLRLVQRLEMGQGVARYEPLDPSGDHHHHLVCQRCGNVVPFDDPDLESSIAALCERLEFDVDEHDVVLRGACVACRER
jgi:Fur family transcriptional regulator, ferric uptake regulator